MHAHRPDATDKNSSSIQWLSLGLEFGGVLALFSYGGYRLDRVWLTEPWCLVVGFLVALAGMLYLTIRRALNDQMRPKQQCSDLD